MMPGSPPRSIQFGPFEADFHTQELRKHGIKLKLSGQPLQILQMLLARPGELVTREELQKLLWTDDVNVDSNHGLNAAVNKLRDALSDSAEEPSYIETLPRRGYRFIGTIQPEPLLAEQPAVIPITLTTVHDNVEELRRPAQRNEIAASVAIALRRSDNRRWVIASAATLLAVVAMTAFFVAENLLEPLLRHLPGNSASSIQNSQAPPEAGRSKSGDTTIPAANSEKSQVKANRNHYDERGISGAHESRSDSDVLTISEQQSGSPMLHTIVADDNQNAAPQFSPDGKRIAYMSTRTGDWQIWVSDTNGANARQLSFTESAGTPRWSPDGRRIAFDAPLDGQTRIFVIQVDGNEQARPIVKGLVPSFSRDGKWVYFASDQTGDWQLWKVPVSGGREVQLTTNGGFAALESADGYVYYSKSRYPQPEICRIPVNGGAEACILQHLRPRTWASWAVTREGIVFAEDLPNGVPTLSLYDPAKRQVRDLVSLRSAPFWVGASADGKRAIMNDSEERQISMVDHLR
jgi:DNA-binding winged helix-turn-helix (wHTH) protein